MAKSKKPKEPPPPTPEEVRAATLPDSRAELLAQAKQAQQLFRDSVVAGDQAGLEEAALWSTAIIWKMNGGTMFGSYADDNSPGCVVDRVCGAPPGVVPQWGQSGEFVVTTCGVRALVSVKGDGLSRTLWIEFRALDLDRPFISETGFRACMNIGFAREDDRQPMRETVVQTAERALADLVHAEKSEHDGGKRGLQMVRPEALESCREFIASCTWLAGASLPQADETFEEKTGQVAFAF